MISGKINRVVRKGDLTKIENYDKAVADKTQVWECHHRLELTLEGEFAHTSEELKRMEMYYNRPYFELIFLTPTGHRNIHGKEKKGMKFSEEHRKNLSESHKGKKLSEEHKQKLIESRKGKNISEETRKKLSESHKGIKFSEERRKNISEAHKGIKMSEETKKKKSVPKSEFGKKYFEHYGYNKRENKNQYDKERRWYNYHNNKCSWEV
jgi:hypothetical protein